MELMEKAFVRQVSSLVNDDTLVNWSQGAVAGTMLRQKQTIAKNLSPISCDLFVASLWWCIY
jgi:hypothetical protein